MTEDLLTRADLDLIEVFCRIDESPFSTSTDDNWVARLGGLPPYLRGIVRGIMKTNGGDFQAAIATGVQALKLWAAGKMPWSPHHTGHPTPQTQAKAQAAVAQWEAMKAAAHAGGSGKRSAQVRASTSQTGRPGAYGKGPTGAYAAGHPFHGNQHTGSIVQPHTPQTDGPGASAPAQGPLGEDEKQKLLNDANKAQQAVNEAVASKGETAKQQASNVAFNQQRLAAGMGTSQVMDAANTKQTAVDAQNAMLDAEQKVVDAAQRLKDANKAVKAAGLRDDGGEPLVLRDFVGETGTSGSANFLPAGPTATQDKRIKKKLLEPQGRPSDRGPDSVTSKHPFRGNDLAHCDLCGLPVTDPVHEQVDPHASRVPTINNSVTLGSAGGVRASLAGNHRFCGDDLWSCKRCGMPITASTHTTYDAMVVAAKEAAHKPSGQPVPPIPRQARGTYLEHLLPSQSIRTAGDGSAGTDHPDQRHSNEKALDRAEGPLEEGLRSHFQEQRRATLNRFNGKRGGQMLRRAAALYPQLPRDVQETTLSHSTTPPGDPTLAGHITPADLEPDGPVVAGVDPGAVFDQSHWTGKLRQVLEPHLAGTAALARARVAAVAGHEPGHDDEVRSAVSRRALLAAQVVTNTTARHIRAALQAGIAAGETRQELASRLADVFEAAESSRAAQIARTQVNGTFNEASLEHARSLPQGLLGRKVWLTHPESARPEHVAADLQERRLDEPFEVGGASMDYPGDTGASIDEWINCRCSQAFLPPGADSTSGARLVPELADSTA